MLGLLALEGFLLLSAWFRWFPFNQHKGWTVLITVASVGVALLLMSLWFLAALVFRLRFQFSILALLLLAVVVAVPFSWLATEVKAAKKQRDMVEELKRAGGHVEYDYQRDRYGNWVRGATPPGPSWLRRLLGDSMFIDVSRVDLDDSGTGDSELNKLEGFAQLEWLMLRRTAVSDAGLAHLEGLAQLRLLDLDGTRVGDAGLVHLKGLAQLRILGLDSTKVSDAGLVNLKGLTQLRTLGLRLTKVGDAGLVHLESMTELRWLYLGSTNVSDAGLEHLRGLTYLGWLDLRGTKVTGAGVRRLEQALPGRNISYRDDGP